MGGAAFFKAFISPGLKVDRKESEIMCEMLEGVGREWGNLKSDSI
jgi:hypothetical protein